MEMTIDRDEFLESVSHVQSVVDRRNTYKACARSWKRRPDVGQDSEFPDLSLRDAAAVRAAKVRHEG